MTAPIVSFYRAIESGLPPARAGRSAGGTLPVRGVRYCEAVTSASAFGWHIFPPFGFSLMWDGETVAWATGDEWYRLDEAAQYPNGLDRFDSAAPSECKGFCPPWLLRGVTPGIVQVWTGIIVSTAPGWSLLIRAPANLGRSWGFETFEGIIETDRWTGPLFVNLRLIATDTPCSFPARYPFLQVQPVPRSVYGDEVLNSAEIASIAAMDENDWRGFHETIVTPAQNPDRPLGDYAVRVRKRRATETVARRFRGC